MIGLLALVLTASPFQGCYNQPGGMAQCDDGTTFVAFPDGPMTPDDAKALTRQATGHAASDVPARPGAEASWSSTVDREHVLQFDLKHLAGRNVRVVGCSDAPRGDRCATLRPELLARGAAATAELPLDLGGVRLAMGAQCRVDEDDQATDALRGSIHCPKGTVVYQLAPSVKPETQRKLFDAMVKGLGDPVGPAARCQVAGHDGNCVSWKGRAQSTLSGYAATVALADGSWLYLNCSGRKSEDVAGLCGSYLSPLPAAR